MLFIGEDKERVFSSLSGYNFYYITEKYKDEYGSINAKAIHELNGTDVEIRYNKVLSNEQVMKKWKYFIEHPIDISNMLWPIDIVMNDEGEYGLVFRRRAFPPLKPIKNLLYNDVRLDWRNRDIQKLIKNFLELCKKIHDGGYAYHCFDMKKMRYNPQDMSVLFDFSLSMARTYGDVEYQEEINHVDVGLEFLSPWQELFENNKMSLVDDYYAIATILFRLMIGRMPYQGRLMDGVGNMMNFLRDTDANDHINMFRVYRKNPIFIFDENDQTNEIGIFAEEETFVERWNALPENIKKMFGDVLKSENVKNDISRRKYYSPNEWMEVLTKQCFNAEGE